MGKGESWSGAEVKALINIWMEGNIQEVLDGAVGNKAIYEKIAKCLEDAE